MKKLLSLLLALCMLAPAAALADTRDDLTDVTQKVVDLLQIGDDYTDFSGDYIDAAQPYWSLSWTKDDVSLWAECTEDGLLLSMQRTVWSADDSDYFYGYDPSLPEVSRDSAAEQAAYWCERLLDEDESAELDDGYFIRYTGEWSFEVQILKNSLPTPITASIRIDEDGLSYYQRSDEYDPIVGETPSAVPAVSEADAAALLTDGVALACRYEDTDGSGTARLVWVPVSDDAYVDAQTGEVVWAGTEYEVFNTAMMGVESARADGAYTSYRELTETELAAIDTYDGVLTEAEIDASLRGIALLGLDGFELTVCSFSMENGSDKVEADLTYVAQLDEDHLYGFSTEAYEEAYYGDTMQVYCYITVDAFTGLPLSVSRWWPLESQSPSEINPDTQAQTDAAESFIAQCAPDLADGVTQDEENSGRYVRTENGYPYPDNYIYVDVNGVTGTVDDFEIVWDEEETFAEPVAPIGEQTALEAYLVPAETELGYVDEYIDTTEWYSSERMLKLAWYFTGTDDIFGVDAETGELLHTTAGDETVIAYTDLDGCPQRDAIETLAEVGIGFSEGVFEPDSTLTVRDAALLLLQSEGIEPDASDDEQLLQRASDEGFLPDGVSADDPVTAGQFLRMLLAPSRYGYTASLTGIWADAYDGEYAGYAAVADGLGILPEGTEADAPLTRAEAAAILYDFMSL